MLGPIANKPSAPVGTSGYIDAINIYGKAKSRKAYLQECGSGKMAGQCPDCKAWNTFKEVNLGPASAPSIAATNRSGFAGTLSSLQTLNEVDVAEAPVFPAV